LKPQGHSLRFDCPRLWVPENRLEPPNEEAGPQETEATRDENALMRRPFRFETSGSAPCRPSPEGFAEGQTKRCVEVKGNRSQAQLVQPARRPFWSLATRS